MAKKYMLVAGLMTFATLSRKFVADVVYTEEEVGEAINDADDNGYSFFAEVEEDDDGGGEDSASPAPRKVSFGRGKQKAQPVPDDNGDIDTAMGKGPAGGADGKTVTV